MKGGAVVVNGSGGEMLILEVGCIFDYSLEKAFLTQ